MYYDKLCDLGIKLSRRSGTEKTFCPLCHDGRKNKRDRSLSVNITTGEYKCHNTGCEFFGNVRSHQKERKEKNYQRPSPEILKSIKVHEKTIGWFKKRGISKNTIEKFMIFNKSEWMPQTGKEENCICFPYIRDGGLVNIKFRDALKNFKMVKDAELIFYNMASIGAKKKIIIVEGEIDCLSLYESGYAVELDSGFDKNSGEVVDTKKAERSLYAIVSVPNGAAVGNQKLEYLDSCAEWLVGLDEVIVATDGDRAGEELKQELIRRIGIERCRTISYPIEELVPLENNLKRRCKDLNEVLMYASVERVQSCIDNAESIPIDGIYYVGDMFPSMLENFKNGIALAPMTHFGPMDKYFRWKKGDINLFVGWASHGKTTFVIQLFLTKSIVDDWKWAVFCPENYPANDFYDDMIEMYVGKWLDKMTTEEYSEAANFLDQHFFYVYPEDGHDINSINEKFRYLVLKKGVDGVLIDPFNQLDHLQRPYQREDQYLSDVLKDIKRFALLNCVSYNIIAHPIKQNRDEDKSYPPVDMYDISGGAMWANKSDQIVSYYRPRHHEDKTSPDVTIYVQKVKRRRTGGEPGQFDIRMNWGTKRFVDILSGEPFCTRGKTKFVQDVLNQKLWLPFKDDNDTEIGF